MSEADEFPLGQGVRHGERHAHHTVFVRGQLGKEEGGFIEILAR